MCVCVCQLSHVCCGCVWVRVQNACVTRVVGACVCVLKLRPCVCVKVRSPVCATNTPVFVLTAHMRRFECTTRGRGQTLLPPSSLLPHLAEKPSPPFSFCVLPPCIFPFPLPSCSCHRESSPIMRHVCKRSQGSLCRFMMPRYRARVQREALIAFKRLLAPSAFCHAL